MYLKKHAHFLPAVFKAVLAVSLIASLTQNYRQSENNANLEHQVEQLELERSELIVSNTTLQTEADALTIELYGSEIKKEYAMDLAIQVDEIFKKLRDGSVILTETVAENCSYDTRGSFSHDFEIAMNMMIEAAEEYNELVETLENDLNNGL